MKKLLVLLLALLLLLSPSWAQQKLTLLNVAGSSGGGGGGSDFATDSFSGEADLADLVAHTGELASWTHHPAAGYTGNQYLFQTNRVFQTGTNADFANQSPPSADYYSQVEITAVSIISVNCGPCARMDTTADTMYCGRLNNGTSWELRRIVAGTAATIGTASTNNLPTTGQTKTMRLIVTGSTITLNINGVQEVTTTDSNITAAGKAGLRGSGACSASTGFHLDNFSAR